MWWIAGALAAIVALKYAADQVPSAITWHTIDSGDPGRKPVVHTLGLGAGGGIPIRAFGLGAGGPAPFVAADRYGNPVTFPTAARPASASRVLSPSPTSPPHAPIESVRIPAQTAPVYREVKSAPPDVQPPSTIVLDDAPVADIPLPSAPDTPIVYLPPDEEMTTFDVTTPYGGYDDFTNERAQV